MKKNKIIIILGIIVCLFLVIFKVTSCSLSNSGHSYSSEWSYDDVSHWHACIDEGYEHLKIDEAVHDDSNEIILQPASSSNTGFAQYTCSVCNHTYTKIILIDVEIITLPTASIAYVGSTLSSVSLTGGSASVEGEFYWTNPNDIVTGDGYYSVIFIPTESDKYSSFVTQIYLLTESLTIYIEVGENGSANYEGNINVKYGETLEIEFTPNTNYKVSRLVVDNVEVTPSSKYIFSKINSNHTLSVFFSEYNNIQKSYQIICLLGTEDAYVENDDTITFTTLSENSVYMITGEFDGSIIVDVGDDYEFELELHGFNLTGTSSLYSPFMILSGNKVTLTAKNGYESNVNDNRETVADDDETQVKGAIYSAVDLVIGGKGKLNVISENNNGIHSKDDLKVKNLSLYVECNDNALKGNDSVTISNCETTLIAKKGDGVKTSNSDISSKGNQRGTISISGGTHNIYAACDGIDASYDVNIDDETTKLNIYTDKYSPYSEEVTAVSASTYYIRYSSTNYNYSVKYYNSNTNETLWVNASFYKTITSSGGQGQQHQQSYNYYSFDKKTDYNQMAVYMYSSSQAQGQDSNYTACTSFFTLNDSYDTIVVTKSNNSKTLSYSWSNYTTTISSNNQGGGGQEEGNPDKGDYSTKGIKASNQIIVSEGIINIKSYDDALHANNDDTLENNATPLGNVTILGGTLNIYSNDDGLHADGTLTIDNGTITITNCYEGIEGGIIEVNNGSVSVTSKDDGFNSPSTTGTTITINGGNIFVVSGGDGLDSNSTTSYAGIIFNGGNIVVLCNSNGNSSIDTEKGYTYNGGRVIALTKTGGMTNEQSNCSNYGSVATSKSVALTTSNYLTITVNSIVIAVLNSPINITGTMIYLGSNSASITTTSSSSYTLDSNGVYWY